MPAAARRRGRADWDEAFAVLVRYRLPAVAALATGVALLRHLPAGNDAYVFTRAGNELTGSNGLDVFQDPYLQVGPAYLLWVALLCRASAVSGLPVVPLYSAVTSAVVAVVSVLLVRWLRERGDRFPEAELAVGVAVALASPVTVLAMTGHQEEALTLLGWLVAGTLAQRGRALPAGAMLGLCAATKLWGLLGVPLLLLGARPARIRLASAGVAGLFFAAAYAPFLLGGTVHTLDHRWVVRAPAPLSLLLDSGSGFGYSQRLLQAAVTVLAGVIAVTVAADDRFPAVRVAAAMTFGRLLIDPFPQNYYSVSLQLCLLVWAWSRVVRGGTARGVGWSCLCPFVLVPADLTGGRTGAVVFLASLLAGLLATCWPRAAGGGRKAAAAAWRLQVR